MVSRDELTNSCSWAVESLFDLLGLDFAREGKKCVPFEQVFKMLGLQVDLRGFGQQGFFNVGHTPERRGELSTSIDEILSEGSLDGKSAERLRGRMIFFEGYTFGRLANASVKNLGRYCTNSKGMQKMDEDMKFSLITLRDRVLSGRPLCLAGKLLDTWIVFTDGAFEASTQTGSIGGVLVDPAGTPVEFFGFQIEEDFMSELLEGSRNPIHELEILPVTISAWQWAEKLRGSPVIFYIDNESAKMAFIRGSGETKWARVFLQEFVQLESDLELKTWFSRVPSFSNLSDDASRLCFENLLARGVTQTSVDWERVIDRLGWKQGDSGRR